MAKRYADGRRVMSVQDRRPKSAKELRGDGYRIRIVIYARTSTEEQKDDKTIEFQLAALKRWIGEHPDWDLVGRYVDDDVRSIVPWEDRPEGRRLLKDAADGAFDAIVAWDVKRIGRKPWIVYPWIHDVVEGKGRRLVTLDDHLDSEKAGAYLHTAIATLIAEVDYEAIRTRTSEGRLRHQTEVGRWVMGPLPFGWNFGTDRVPFVDTDLVQPPLFDEATKQPLTIGAAVREWFFGKIARREMSARQVARYWNAHGIPAVTRYAPGAAKVRPFKRGVPGHGMWTERRITAIIRNPIYWGEPEVLSGTHGAVPYQRPLPPIVTKELALQAQAALAANKRRPTHERPKHLWLYGGKLVCDRCGMSFVGAPQKGYFYYRCDSWSASEHLSLAPKRICQSCGAKMVQEAAVDRAVWPKVRAAVEQRAAIFADAWDRFLDARADRDGNARHQAELQARIRELGAKQERIKRMVKEGWEDYHTGKAEVEAIERAKAVLEGELRSLRDADNLADDYRTRLGEWQRRVDEFAADLDAAEADPTLKRRIIDGVVREVRVITSGSGRMKQAALTLTLALGPVPVNREQTIRSNGAGAINEGGVECASPGSRPVELTAISL